MKRSKDGSVAKEKTLHSTWGQTTGKTSRRTLTFSHEASEENGEDPLTVEEKMQASGGNENSNQGLFISHTEGEGGEGTPGICGAFDYLCYLHPREID